MSLGTVKWFNAQKGYGFIQPQDASKDVFVHISALERAGIDQLREGQKVSYEVEQDRGKPSACPTLLCPELALSGRPGMSAGCPLSGCRLNRSMQHRR